MTAGLFTSDNHEECEQSRFKAPVPPQRDWGSCSSADTCWMLYDCNQVENVTVTVLHLFVESLFSNCEMRTATSTVMKQCFNLLVITDTINSSRVNDLGQYNKHFCPHILLLFLLCYNKSSNKSKYLKKKQSTNMKYSTWDENKI